MAKVVACYKTYDGEEWLQASLSSVYNSVDRIFLFDSPCSWLGERNNTVQSVIRDFIRDTDVNGKVTVVPYQSSDQNAQYRSALNYLNRRVEFDYLLIVDSDEIWDFDHLESAKQHIDREGGPVYSVAMRTYIKSPYYLIEPTEPCRPCTFVRRGVEMVGVRGNKTPGMQQIPGVFFHHFTGVRASEATIRRKILQSNTADDQAAVSIDRWMETKWAELPDAVDFHYTSGYERAWRRVRVIGHKDLPQVLQLQDYPIVDAWRYTQKVDKDNLPFGSLLPEDEAMLREYAAQRINVVDLGTFLGRSAAIMAELADHVTTVDIHENLDLIADAKWRRHYQQLYEQHPHPYETVKRTLAAWDNITVVQGATYQPVAEDVDMLFVDADHSYKGARRDLEAYLPYLTDGAWVLFHDSVDLKTGCCEYVRDVVSHRPDFELDSVGGSITAFKYLPTRKGEPCDLAPK